MKILVNASTVVVGGGVQVARSLIIEFSKMSGGQHFVFVVSPEVAAVLPEGIQVDAVSQSPSGLLGGKKAVKRLKAIEKDVDPDIVLTIFGPAYWKPGTRHVCGFANPWVFTSNKYAWKTKSIVDHTIARLKGMHKRLRFIVENADAYILETDSMKQAINRFRPRKPAYVIPNGFGEAFKTCSKNKIHPQLPRKRQDEFRLVTLTGYYPHKNLEIIPLVANCIARQGITKKIRFLLSLPSESPEWRRICEAAERLSVSDMIHTVGPVHPECAPSFYDAADVMFLPTVLESFSANYPEAMVKNVPIVTTDLPFARNVCGDAASYFRPMDAEDAAVKIIKLVKNPQVGNILRMEGQKIISTLPAPSDKAKMYVDFCRDLVAAKNNPGE